MKYQIAWKIKGRTTIEAENEDEATAKFNGMYASEIAEDYTNIGIDKIWEQKEEK